MIPQSIPPINSRVTIVIEDSCNSCCLPWNRNKSPCRSTKEKTNEVFKEKTTQHLNSYKTK